MGASKYRAQSPQSRLETRERGGAFPVHRRRSLEPHRAGRAGSAARLAHGSRGDQPAADRTNQMAVQPVRRVDVEHLVGEPGAELFGDGGRVMPVHDSARRLLRCLSTSSPDRVVVKPARPPQAASLRPARADPAPPGAVVDVRIEQPCGHSVLAGDEHDDRIRIGRCHVCALPRIGRGTRWLRSRPDDHRRVLTVPLDPEQDQHPLGLVTACCNSVVDPTIPHHDWPLARAEQAIHDQVAGILAARQERSVRGSTPDTRAPVTAPQRPSFRTVWRQRRRGRTRPAAFCPRRHGRARSHAAIVERRRGTDPELPACDGRSHRPADADGRWSSCSSATGPSPPRAGGRHRSSSDNAPFEAR